MRHWIDLCEGQHSGYSPEEEADDFDLSMLGPTGTFTVYHASPVRIAKFKPFTHFGTERAARDLARDKLAKGSSFLHKVELTVLKSCEILDSGYGQHDVEGMMSYLETMLNLDMNEVETVFRNPRRSAALLARYGYDTLHYTNRREDPGSMSWVSLDPNKIKIISIDQF